MLSCKSRDSFLISFETFTKNLENKSEGEMLKIITWLKKSVGVNHNYSFSLKWKVEKHFKKLQPNGKICTEVWGT